ncbi:MAG: hypothetical protein M9963_00880 [Kiritimatiellae bacterium]|nr:hypothetical protein [Kiritimatiellia bacterium]MCO5067217.1 hypothetical protein [Kiritimatiellia bacterium]
MQFACPHCKQLLEVGPETTADTVQCPSCGRYIKNPRGSSKAHAAQPTRIASGAKISAETLSSVSGESQRVVITDIKMPISSMIVFMLKWFVASIPVVLLIGAVYFFVTLLFFGGCAALMAASMR